LQKIHGHQQDVTAETTGEAEEPHGGEGRSGKDGTTESTDHITDRDLVHDLEEDANQGDQQVAQQSKKQHKPSGFYPTMERLKSHNPEISNILPLDNLAMASQPKTKLRNMTTKLLFSKSTCLS
jgi:hypothetical protein